MAKRSAIIKRDTVENWKKSAYIPDENVIILMDHDDGSISLMIGDGETNVNELPDLIEKRHSSFSKAVVDENTLIL